MKKKLLIVVLIILLIAAGSFIYWYKSQNTTKDYNRTMDGLLVNTVTWEVEDNVTLTFDGTRKHTFNWKENYITYNGIFSLAYQSNTESSYLYNDCQCILPIVKGQRSSIGSFDHLDFESDENPFDVLGYVAVNPEKPDQLVFRLPVKEQLSANEGNASATASSDECIIAPANSIEDAKKIYNDIY